MEDNNKVQNQDAGNMPGNGYQNNGNEGTGIEYPQNNGYSQNNDGQDPYNANAGYTNNGYQNQGYHQNNNQPCGNMPPYTNGQLELEEPVKVSEWILSMVLMMLPCVNIVMMFVWAFSNTEKKSKSNYFKAALIFNGIMIGIMVLLWMAIIIFAAALY